MEKQYRINISAPNLVAICIDGEDDDVYGRLYHCYSRESFPFKGAIVLLNLMQDFFDSISYPQAARTERCFVEHEHSRNQNSPLEKVVKQTDIIKERGALRTYITYVQYRQNSTWQGNMVWVEKEKYYNFISELEFIKLIGKNN